MHAWQHVDDILCFGTLSVQCATQMNSQREGAAQTMAAAVGCDMTIQRWACTAAQRGAGEGALE